MGESHGDLTWEAEMNTHSDAYRSGVKAALDHVFKKTFEKWASEPTSSLAKILVETSGATKPEEVWKAEGHTSSKPVPDFMSGATSALRDLLSIHVS